MRASLIRHTDGSVTLNGEPQPDLAEPYPNVAPIPLENGYSARCSAEDGRLGHSLHVYGKAPEALYGFGISRKGVYAFDEYGYSFIPMEILPPKSRKPRKPQRSKEGA